jgi:cellulose synthase/poly-beta-1,6-N-acetylglucosamine synthase-like glycosyltransferase
VSEWSTDTGSRDSTTGRALSIGEPVVIVTLLCELALVAVVCAAGVHLFRGALWAFGAPRLDSDGRPAARPKDDPPLVTVQLPIRNERFVAERVIRAADSLRWPRLEIQVLDDSDDETSALIDRVAVELKGKGRDVAVVRRPDRRGYKAGNLEHGLLRAQGEYLLVLDADSQPPVDLLERLMPPLLAAPRAAFCQARWTFDNESASLLCRLQALLLSGLFTVEQARLAAANGAVPFNGTAGVWRRAAIEAAGGWHADDSALTEDLDLTYRARLAGYTGLHHPEVAVRTELPATMAAFRAQQARWVRGAGLVGRTLFRRLLGGAAPAEERARMLAHLLRHGRQPLIVAVTLLVCARALGVGSAPLPAWVWPATLAWATMAVVAYYAAALRRLGRTGLSTLWLGPLLLPLSVGLSFELTLALCGGLAGRRGGGFQRTPKTGGATTVPRGYRAHAPVLAVVETVLGLSATAAAGAALMRGDPLRASGVLLLAAGYLWVGLASLRS